MFENIGSGQAISCVKNGKGGYDVILRTNQTDITSYVLLSRTSCIVKHAEMQVYE